MTTPRVRSARSKLNPQNRLRGATVPPEKPSGRFVVTPMANTRSENVKASQGGAQYTHWLPATGTVWVCSDCGRQFARDEDRRGVPWRAA